jgi:RHS repeat-associated protein
MTQYKANVGSSSMTGTPTWNANWTLGTLGIVDGLNSKDTQSCSYAYDSLARLTSAGCGSTIWSQSFSYDAFGNITKTGSQSFGPTYSETTNRYTAIGSVTPTYDSNGNVTYDGFYNYTWDGEGNLATLSGNAETYDALDRRVEQYNGSAYTEIVYGPAGNKFALMSGQTVTKVFAPLSGGATAVYTSSGLSYYRHPDWLGSSRVASTPTQTLYYDGAYAPFGENYAETGTTDRNFTGQNQDLTPGATAPLYDFLYREYQPTQGRWVSPDRAGLTAVDPTNPQSWGRYNYALNNPLRYIDPSGLDYCAAGSALYDSNGNLVGYDDSQCVSDEQYGDGSAYAGYTYVSTTENITIADQSSQEWTDPGSGADSPWYSFLGIRAPGQTFGQCMAQNASTYSIGGSVELAINVATGTSSSISSNAFVGAVAGNSVNTLLFGGTTDAGAGMASNAPGLVSSAMGAATTFGRRTTTIMSLNLLGTPGGPPLALSQASAPAKAMLGKLGTALSLGMKFTTRLAVDAAFTAAEAINCSIPK